MLRICRIGHGFSQYLTRNALPASLHHCVLNLNTDLTAELHQIRRSRHGDSKEHLKHLICFKDWDPERIKEVICSASNLKNLFGDTHGKKMDLLKCTKVMILEDHNEPILRMAVSKAVSMLGASDVHIVEALDWEHDFIGRVYSEMADTIFVSSLTYGCLKRFAEHSLVPVVCMRSRRHASIQSLATIMSIIEDHGKLENLNIAYVGAPHQVLNDYLILCPMLGANLNFKCCCNKCKVSPLLLDDSKHICEKSCTKMSQVIKTPEALKGANVIIAGPTTRQKEKIPEFVLSVDEIKKHTQNDWTFYHTFPRGEEVDDTLFFHENSRTFNAFRNTQFIAAALMVYILKSRLF
ncbi:unnamed protein product [Arctia plantaginis]|uniref:ornithine carbamoyltransferase n=1 Tax=Arctia plantaginis TaxID=874455 RepID=A0A8S1BF55_ARCPL|nr:unnamed protein product [Arctia plantaginis]CAB3258459.1 unnamed protein product [Arctia plantaginis]